VERSWWPLVPTDEIGKWARISGTAEHEAIERTLQTTLETQSSEAAGRPSWPPAGPKFLLPLARQFWLAKALSDSDVARPSAGHMYSKGSGCGGWQYGS
jgi:hypothetical protein